MEEYYCKKTGKKFNSLRGLLNHLKKVYNSLEEAYIQENNITVQKCCNCSNPRKFKSYKEGFYEHCGNRECIKASLKKSNKKNAERRKNKKQKLSFDLIKWLFKVDKSIFKKTNIDILGKNCGNLTVNQYLSRNYLKPQRYCKYCGKKFELSFDDLNRHHCYSKTCIQLFKNGYYKIKNNFSYKELNNKWYELYQKFGQKKSTELIKHYMRNPDDFNHIYHHNGNNSITINGWKFLFSTNNSSLLNFLKNNIDKKYWIDLVYIKCKQCGKLADTNKSLAKKYTRSFCSRQCYIEYKKNHPEKYVYKESSKLKQSITLKNKILRGEFTPSVTNSWCKSRVNYKSFAFRSAWEFLFYILNESDDLLFEKLRIPYVFNGVKHNYIVDFINYKTLEVFEIKPNSEKNTIINKIKQNELIKWCEKNGFKYHLITEDYFYNQTINEKHRKLIKELNLEKKLKQFL